MSEGIDIRSLVDYLAELRGLGIPEADDVIATILPLVKQIQDVHAQGQVAPLNGLGAISVTAGQAWFESGSALAPTRNPDKVEQLQKPISAAIDVVEHLDITQDFTELERTVGSGDVRSQQDELKRPVYVAGYLAWEQLIDHHDELSDVFVLGLILASLALGLDLTDGDDLKAFVRSRDNLYDLNPRLNPVIEKAIVQTTELNRHRRLQDLRVLVHRLENYRDLQAEARLDFDAKGFRQASLSSRRERVLAQLRDRLFEVSKRNRLIYFKSTMGSVNLTESSVPLLLKLEHIQPEHLFLWHGTIRDHVVRGKPIPLKRYLRFEEYPYLGANLDNIRSQARKDRKEFGFSQLRLVLCFFRWHNLRDEPAERIHSPLLLLPVELEKKRGVRDSYELHPITTEAEVNPALRHFLKQLYNLDLPEAVDLEQTDLDSFHAALESKIKASEPGIDLRKVDKPRIDLIHAKAVQRLDQYRRHARLTGRGIRRFEDIDYSYTRGNYQPLGLQLFSRRVRPADVPFHDMFADPKPRPAAMAGAPVVETSRMMYSVRQGTENPYTWELDLCSMTLGSFNYRKMTLVRDYMNLLDGEFPNPVFDQLFAATPKALEAEVLPEPQLDECFHVVDCDPTQARAVSACSQRDSLIIQGPPGTGKSQTITNLIADFVARGKRVLFVCEKRAAIDVVYYRLKQKGLHHLCSLIHDSQTDKKEFIQDLKACYEAFITREPPMECLQVRDEKIEETGRILAILAEHGEALHNVDAEHGVSAQQILRRLVALADYVPELDPVEEEALPSYADWVQHGQTVTRICRSLRQIGHHGPLCTCPLSAVQSAMYLRDHPIRAISDAMGEANRLLAQIRPLVESLPLPQASTADMAAVGELCRIAAKLRSFAERRLLELLDPSTRQAAAFDAGLADHAAKLRALAEAAKPNVHWSDKLPPDDTELAVEQAKRFEGSFLSFLQPAFWRLRRVLRERYDFTQHAVRPTWSKILANLAAEHAARREFEGCERTLREQFRVEEAIEEFAESVVVLRQAVAATPVGQALFARLRGSEDNQSIVESLLELGPLLDSLRRVTGELLRLPNATFDQLASALAGIDAEIGHVPDMAAISRDLDSLSESLRAAALDQPLGLNELEAAIAQRSFHDICRRDRSVTALPMSEVERHLRRLKAIHREVLDLNSVVVLARTVNGFRRNLQISAMPASQLSEEDKAFKKLYVAGRRELEHEFHKTMRYCAIRELAEGETGKVIGDFKPVWLMSPVSVADTLPLGTDLFDVVIFDEASQIPVEEAVPAIFRAGKMIVVGDEMQLPPTNFFAGRSSIDEDELEEGPLYELQTDSFLSMASDQLPTTMLGWHYRSRSEALISFSNACFYKGELLTIPDKRRPADSRPAIEACSAEDAEGNLPHVLGRSISFHRMCNGVYEKRRNAPEAAYIAQLVRALLRDKVGLSIGIVAFSEAQQSEIEAALRRLAEEDDQFQDLLEHEYEREEDDQFCGLFVKNLENVQGDERDIIILSVCYGPDPNGRMVMNFGPINQNGGEKRLNVIFSRARHHMVVVSTITGGAITNTYNDGANCFRRYLEYSQAVSEGHHAAAARVLGSLAPAERLNFSGEALDPVVASLKEALEEIGCTCHANVGQSDFVIDLAVSEDDDEDYELGIVVDSERFYANDHLLERYLLRPELLRHFGWRILLVKTSDWYRDREWVLDRVLRELRSPADDDETPAQGVTDTYAGAASGNGDTDYAALVSASFGTAVADEDNGKVDYGKAIAENIKVTQETEIHPDIENLQGELVAKLVDLSQWVNGEYRQAAYRNAARSIESLPEEELRSRVTFVDIKGIGKATNELILEFRRTGTIKAWERLRKKQ